MKQQIENDARVRASEDQMSCDLDGEAAVLHLPSGIYFGLNEVGASVWRMVQSETTVASIVRGVEEEYDVAPETCAADVRRLLTEMMDAGIVEVVEAQKS